MIRFARDIRLIPVALIAMTCLFVLKVSGLVLDGGYTLGERLQNRYKTGLTATTADSVPDYPKIVLGDEKGSPDQPVANKADSKPSWAEAMFNFNGDASRLDDNTSRDITGSIDKGDAPAGPPPSVSKKPPAPAKIKAGNTSIVIEPGRNPPPGEIAVLKRLKERREELDARSRDMDMRENLLKAAEKRVEAKLAELKATEARIKATLGTRTKQEADRFKSIVTMYENMKSKDAARIFDHLDMKVLVSVSTEINPRKMAEIMAQMTPEAAERLTVELADRASGKKSQPAVNHLPKIQGKPAGS
jgi:flagellar motility protein MotE (MotC chaperone)